MSDLLLDRNNALEDLLAHLSAFPAAELIATSAKLRMAPPLDETKKKQFRQSLAGAFAVGKIVYYTHALRQIDSNRLALGKEIKQMRSSLQRARSIGDIDAITRLDTQIVFFAGVQETTIHFFAICVSAIHGLYPLVAKATGYKVAISDKNVLKSFVPLRNYFEHIENRAPGKSHAHEVVAESSNEYEWRIVSNLPVDKDGRIVIDRTPVDVTSRGLEQVLTAISNIYEGCMASCLLQVRDYYLTRPADIPSPSQVPYRPLLSTFTAQDQFDIDGE